ncbi:unnamed protein product [Rotaria sordida]|uniref:p-glycoprotein n=1 Tax=Rotaria sordida TaxID=392033 RepID=A0A819V2K0_9BILA|nr:unnamed protein product [Rotaria sordida]
MISLLDAKNESEVQIGLERASQGRTTIVVAHRLTTIRKAHHIIGLNAGQIDEQGTHEELMRLNGRYAQAVKLQRIMNPHDENDEDEDNDCENGNNNASENYNLTKKTSNAHLRNRSTSSHKSDVSGLSANYLFT